MTSRLYTVPIQLTAVTVAVDLWDLAPADDKPIVLHAIYLGQTTETGDAMEENIGLQIIRGFATVGSGGSAPTPTPIGPSDAAAGFTARILDTTAAVVGGGTTTHCHADAWYLRGSYVYIPTPEYRWQCTQAQTRLVIRLAAAPADSITVCGTAYVEELG